MSYWLPRALVMAHYDPDGIIDSHVLYSLAVYRPLFERIVFVSVSADRMPPGSEHLVDDFVQRDNVGYDFLSWKLGFQKIADPGRYFEIVFANDSVYGPFFDMQQAFLAPHIKSLDFWGMVGSFERHWHIQSWFFAMRHELLKSRDVAAFWDSVKPLRNKQDIIANYELSMASFFHIRGWQTGALYTAPSQGRVEWSAVRARTNFRDIVGSMRQLRLYRNVTRAPPNPMHLLWSETIKAGVPYAKVELLRSNPLGIATNRALEFIATNTRYPLSLIQGHLKRTRGR
jgi:lipopolysaccharide biosynthesis protein